MMTFDLQHNIVYLNIVGSPTPSDIKHLIAAQINHPDYQSGMNELWDFREASMGHISEQDLRVLADYVKETFNGVKKRIAFVVNDSLSFGMGRMWITIAELSGAKHDRRLFESVDAAQSWLISPVTSDGAAEALK